MGKATVNFKEGMRRLGIVLGGLGCTAGAIASCLLAQDVQLSWSAGTSKESLLFDGFVLLALPVLGFVIPWSSARVLAWICSGFSA